MKKRFAHYILALFAVVACGEKQEPEITSFKDPVSIKGEWVVSASDNGSGLNAQDINEVMVFDGNGKYTIASCPKGAHITDGQIDIERNSLQAGSTTYSATTNGELYRFESIKAVLNCKRSSSKSYTFDCKWDSSESSSIKSIRLDKILAFKGESMGDGGNEGLKINGTTIEDGNDLIGTITNTVTGAGIEGVVVSDGYNCTTTDANGVYQFKSTPGKSRLVFYSTPSEYAINTQANDSAIPLFYALVDITDKPYYRKDFLLTPLEGGKETNWTFVGVGDPQCSNSDHAARFESETMVDMNSYLANFKNVYAMTLGDVVFDSNSAYAKVKAPMSKLRNGTRVAPFFQTIGNHDHDASYNEDGSEKDAYTALSTFISHFGPVDYSFNRGDVHIVSMDDVRVSNTATSSHSNKHTWNYSAGFTDEQMNWLRQDLSYIKDKDKKMIFFCCHIPVVNRTAAYMSEIKNLLLEFKEAHIMIGHTHYHRNWVHTGLTCKGGLTLYEHIHGAACGAWWSENTANGKLSNVTVTGGPSGYTVYDIEGNSIVGRRLKGTRRDDTHQLRVYDGNQIYSGVKGYNYCWYATEKNTETNMNYSKNADVFSRGLALFKGCFIAEVFDDDDTYWKVEFWQDGVKKGDFKRVGSDLTSNVVAASYFYNQCNKSLKSYSSTSGGNYWYYKPASADPLSERNWEVRVTFTHPGSGKVFSYKADKLTTDYSDYDL